VALAILTERDFVDAYIGQSCGCETAQGVQGSFFISSHQFHGSVVQQ